MVIIPNLVLVAILTIPFFIALIGCHFILFKPMMEYLSEREQATDGARAEARRLGDEIDNRMSTLHERLTDAREEVAKLRTEARARATSKEAQILEDAREQADRKIESALARIREEQAVASKALKDTASSLSTDIAAQVLGREVTA